MALSLIFDSVQSRVKQRRVAAFTQGGYPAEEGGYVSGWSDRFGSGTFYDRSSFTLMLQPSAFEADFIESNSGRYAKLARADFTLTDSTQWTDMAYSNGMTFMQYNGSTYPAEGVTTTTWGRNRGFYLGWYQNGAGAGAKALAVDCGWNTSADGGDGPSFRFYVDGSVEVWRDGILRGTYSLSGDSSQQSQQQPQQYIGVVLIPARFREWIVISTTGASFTHLDDTIAEDAAPPIIAPATNFWFSFPTMKPIVVVAPLRFPIAGWRASRLVGLADNPTGMAAVDQTFWDTSQSGTPEASEAVTMTMVKASDATTAWTYDGADPNPLQARLRFALTGNGEYTPFVYAGIRDFAPTTANTDDAGVDLIDRTMSLSIDCPESPANVTMNLSLRDPDAIADDGVPAISTGSNRPVQLRWEGITIIDGRTGAPNTDLAPWSEAKSITFEIRDRWKALERARLRDPLPLDGYRIKAALLALLKVAGVDAADTDIYDDPYRLDFGQSPSTGDWATIAQPGEDGVVSSWVTRIMDNFAGSWYYGFKPYATKVKFFAKPPDHLTGSKFTLYSSIANAIAAGFTDHPERHVYRKVRRQDLEPECNEIRVTGWDSRQRRPFQVFKVDAVSQDPTLAVADRPRNWLGEPVDVDYSQVEVGSETAATRMIDELFPKLTQAREMIQFEAEWQRDEAGVPAWRGDLCSLQTPDDPAAFWSVRLATFSTSVIKAPEDEDEYFLDQPTTYCGEIETA